MKRKPPKGYDTWIEVYDSIVAQNPNLLLSRTAWFIYYEDKPEPEARPKIFKVQIKTLLANCWLELQEYRMVKDPSIIAQHYIKNNSDNFHREYTDAACRLLDVLTIEE